jgi:prepilin-type N-terminal cleavage/methylation domain-containing protein
MSHQLSTRFSVRKNEHGFTLPEVLLVCIVLGILAAIAVPIWLGAQKQADAATVKTGLQQSASLVEQEKTDLNGVYPEIIPNEIMQNDLWKKFAYTYSDDHLVYCLQGIDSNKDVWYVSSTNKVPSNVSCVQDNQGKNSVSVWGNVVSTPVNLTASNVTYKWGDITDGTNTATRNQAMTATVSFAPATCSSDVGDATGGTANYIVRFADKTTGSTVYSSGADPNDSTTWNVNTLSGDGKIQYAQALSTYDESLAKYNFLPGDKIEVSVRVVCIETTPSGKPFYFASPNWGTAASTTAPYFTVPKANFTAEAKTAYTTDATPKMVATATFAAITCPIGTPQYTLYADQKNKTQRYASSTNTQVSVQLTNSDQASAANFAGDVTVNYQGLASCVFKRADGSKTTYPVDLNDSSIVAGQVATSSETATLAAPKAATNFATTEAYVSSSPTLPNGFTWTATVCSNGGAAAYYPIKVATNTAAGSTNTNDYKKAVGAGPYSDWTQGTTYKYRLDTICVGVNDTTIKSTISLSSPVLNFTTKVNTPAATWSSTPKSSNPTQTTMAVSGTLNQITCPAGTANYSLTVTQGSKVFTSTMSTNPAITLNVTGLAADTLASYTGYVYCVVPNASNGTDLNTRSTAATTEYTTVAAPNGPSLDSSVNGNDPAVIDNYLTASTVTCPYGGTLYYAFKPTSSSTASAWQSGTGYSPAVAAGTTYSYQAQAYCDGNNRNSSVATGAVYSWTAVDNTPHTPASPAHLTVNTVTPGQTQTATWGAVTCDRNGVEQYMLSQNYRSDTYNGSFYVSTGWITATSYNTSSWIGYQGSLNNYVVVARCLKKTDSSQISGQSSSTDLTGWRSGTYGFYEGIQTPSSPGNVHNDNYTTVGWNAVSCPTGTYDEYYVVQTQRNNNGGSWGLADDYQSTSINLGGNAAGATQQTVYVYADCARNSQKSNDSGGAGTQWIVYQAPTINTGSISGFSDTKTYYSTDIDASGYPSPTYSMNGNPGCLGIDSGNGVISGTPCSDGNFTINVYASNAAGSAGRSFGTGNISNYRQGWHPGWTGGWSAASNVNYDPVTVARNYDGSNSVIKMVTSAYSSGTCNLNGSSTNGICGHVHYDLSSITNGASYHVSACMSASTTSITRLGFVLDGNNDYSYANTSYTSYNGWSCFSRDWNLNNGDYINFIGQNTSKTSEHEWSIAALTITRN